MMLTVELLKNECQDLDDIAFHSQDILNDNLDSGGAFEMEADVSDVFQAEKTVGYETDACDGFDAVAFEVLDDDAYDSFVNGVYDGYEYDDGYLYTDKDCYQQERDDGGDKSKEVA